MDDPNFISRLITAAVVMVPVLAYLWQRNEAKKSTDAAVGPHGANQEYKESAEGNR